MIWKALVIAIVLWLLWEQRGRILSLLNRGEGSWEDKANEFWDAKIDHEKLKQAKAERDEAFSHKVEFKVLRSSIANEGTKLYFSRYKGLGLNDTEALQRLFDDFADIKNPVVVTEGATLEGIANVRRPKMRGRHAYWDGEGTIVNIADGADGIVPEPHIFDKQIGGGGSDDNLLNHFDSMTLKNIEFEGGRIQYMPVAERQAYLDQVRFNRAEVGLYAGFVMQGIARMCQFVFHTRAGAIVRGGETIRSQMDGLGLPQWAIDGDLWSNANSYNSCSNAFEFENSFGFCRPGQPILYGAYHSDKLTWTNPINEGAAPRYSYHLDSGYSPTVQSVNIIRPHIEHGGEDMESMIYARGFNAVRIRDVISHIPDTKFLTIEGDYTLLELSAINYIAMDDNSFDVPESTRVILNQPSQGVGLWANPDLWSGKIPREVFYNSGVDLFGLGGQGIGVRTRNDGGKGVDLLLKNTGLFKRGFRNEFRGTNYTIREKDSYN